MCNFNKDDTFIFAIFKKEWFSLLTPCMYARKILNNNIYSSYYLWRNKEFHTKLPPWRLDGAKKWIHSVTRWSGSHGWFESLTKRKFLVKHLYCTHRKKIIVDNSHEVKVEQTILCIIMFWISSTIFFHGAEWIQVESAFYDILFPKFYHFNWYFLLVHVIWNYL